VREESMETKFHQRDIIVINPYLKSRHNDYVVVSNEEGRQLSRSSKNITKHEYYILSSLNTMTLSLGERLDQK
jgi:phage repressor protein C with HTH and peptisase S24 domain